MSRQCQTPKCREARSSSDSDSRALGWMIWEGSTLGGKPSVVVYCPVHAGRTEEAAEAQETGYDAECDTCMTRASEEWGDEFDGTEAHNCDPQTHLIQPKVKVGAS